MSNKPQKPYLEDLEPKEGVLLPNMVFREVAEETDFRVEDVREVWRIHKNYVKKMMDEKTEVIKLPFFGNLYFNAMIFTRYYNKLNNKSKESKKEYKEFADRVLEKAAAINKEHRKNCPQSKKSNIFIVYKTIMRRILGIKKRLYNPFNMVIETIYLESKGELTKDSYDHEKKILKK